MPEPRPIGIHVNEPLPPRAEVVAEGLEVCDDGNTAVGDGCDASCQDETPTVVTFDATGNDQSWYVPPGVTQITVTSWGAGGGANNGSGDGGGGGYAEEVAADSRYLMHLPPALSFEEGGAAAEGQRAADSVAVGCHRVGIVGVACLAGVD